MNMKLFRHVVLFSLIIFLTGCASRLTPIKTPNTPFERPAYTIYSPPEEGWHFVEYDSAGQHILSFHKPQEEYSHTLFARVEENFLNTKFDKPDDFFVFFKTAMHMGTDPRRFEILEEEIKPDSKFGDYSIMHYTRAEDHGAAQRGDKPFLILETLAYSVIHPKLGSGLSGGLQL